MPTTTPPIPDRTDGQVIDETWFDVLKSVAEDHEGRIDNYETEVREIEFHLFGPIYYMAGLDDLLVEKIKDAYDILSVEIFVKKAGSSGSCEVQLEVSSDGGASWDPVCSANPVVPFSDGDYASDAGVVDAGFDQLVDGDLLRAQIVSGQVGQGHVSLIVKYIPTAL